MVCSFRFAILRWNNAVVDRFPLQDIHPVSPYSRAGCEFSGVHTLPTLAMRQAKSSSHVWRRPKNTQHAEAACRMHLLRTFQEVMPMSKTCNQLYCGLCSGAQSQRAPPFLRRCMLTLSPTPERGYKFYANCQTSTAVCLQRLIVQEYLRLVMPHC